MRTDQLAWGGGLLLIGLLGVLAMPKARRKGRLALHRAAGVTHRSGVSKPGVRTTADPALARPA